MLFAAAPDSPMSSLSLAWWAWMLSALCLSSGLSFAAGFFSARACDRRAYRQARAGLAQLFQTVLKTLDASREACALLERYPGRFLNPDETEQLDRKRTGLLDAIAGILNRHRPPPDEGAADPLESVPTSVETPKINWLLNPTDAATGLPDKQAFESNLASLLEFGRKARQPSSLLLVRVDKLGGLAARLGQAETGTLVKKLAGVICRAVRDADLVCQTGPDLFAVLLPGISVEPGGKLSRAIRDSVRNYHFRVAEDGPEVLLTASFGYTPCRPEDNVELVLNRAVDALTKSQRLGRNHLHVHDGETLVHCTAG